MAKRFLIELAKKSDEPELRRIARDTSMDGGVRFSVQREPDFFLSLEAEGKTIQVCLGRDLRRKKLFGFAVRAIKPLYVNGEVTDIGYLSNLRLEQSYRGGILIHRAYRFLKELHADGRTPLYVTSILQDNQYALRILISGRAGLPPYRDFGGYTTYAIGLRKHRGEDRGDLELLRGNKDMVRDIVTFLREEGKCRQFYPVYTENDFLAREGILRGLCAEDLIIAFQNGNVVGVTGLWDQTGVKQHVVAGYSASMRIMKPFWNFLAPVRDMPSLPAPGKPMHFFFAAMNLSRNNDAGIFHALVERLREEGRERGFDHMVLGLHERDPLNRVMSRYPGFRLLSRIFLVHWEDGKDLYERLDERIPYFEVGAL